MLGCAYCVGLRELFALRLWHTRRSADTDDGPPARSATHDDNVDEQCSGPTGLGKVALQRLYVVGEVLSFKTGIANGHHHVGDSSVVFEDRPHAECLARVARWSRIAKSRQTQPTPPVSNLGRRQDHVRTLLALAFRQDQAGAFRK